MLSKINIQKIINHHLNSLKNDNTGKAEFGDYLVFLILPILIASALIYFQVLLGTEATSIIITTLAILVGLLFNAIIIIFDIVKRDASKRIKNKILKELLANISFVILLSIFAILFTLITFIKHDYLTLIATWILYFLLSVFLFTVLMIMKRMYILFKNEIDELEK